MISKYNYLELMIGYVAKGNFNDFYYLEKLYLNLDEIVKDELVWIDPYNGKSKINNNLIAVKYYTNDEYIILEKNADSIRETKYPIDYLYICSEKFDNDTLLVSHITFRK